jgi:allantoinase
VTSLDTLIKNVRVVRPNGDGAEDLDLGITNGRFARIEPAIAPSDARQVVDGRGMLAFPGLVDAHMHMGIYQPLEVDARNESKAAACGGVTSALTYIRTGKYYLERGGTHADFFPEVMSRSRDNYYVDYGYHLAPINRGHIDEMELMLREYGVASFKIFMFYGGHGLHGRSTDQNDFLMLEDDERYDIAHFEMIMRELARIHDSAPAVSLSLHCELADILTAYTKLVEADGSLSGLRAYSASRPAHSEGLAIFIAAYLANETSFPNINLLHLSSRKAIEAAMQMRGVFPHIDFKTEVTVGHLLLDVDSKAAAHAKVNPPIRPREDVEYLWQAVIDGAVDWVVSDHACCAAEHKTDSADPTDIFKAKSGFGGTEYLLSGMLTEGRRRGLSLNHIARLTSYNPARRFALAGKGDIAVGCDADIALVDEAATYVASARQSPSRQGYTPFEGLELTGRVVQTYLRGELAFDNGSYGPARGSYLKRPYGEAAR